jgi:hypothetical protein
MSASYLIDLYIASSKLLHDFVLLHQRQLMGCILKMDHTFAICKYIKNFQAGLRLHFFPLRAFAHRKAVLSETATQQ